MVVRYRNYKGIPGIYKWENRINHKCYIGQSIDLNKRLAHHFSNIKNNRYDNPLYRAIKKYGLENFDVTIIEVLEASDDLKSKLDEKEVYYINKYNSYGKNGYNQTLGGDGGILGYKFTEEQKEHVSRNSTKVAEEKSKRVYMYNIKTNYIQMWIDIKHTAEYLKMNGATIRKACLDQIHLIKMNGYQDILKKMLRLELKMFLSTKTQEVFNSNIVEYLYIKETNLLEVLKMLQSISK